MFASSTIQTLLQNQTDSESKGNRSLSNRSNPPVIHHSHSRKTLAETKTAKICWEKKDWRLLKNTHPNKKKQQTSFSHQSTATNFRQRPPGGCQQQDTSAVLHTRCSLFSFCASYPLPKQKGPRTRTESPIPSWDAPHEHQAKRRSLAKKSEKFPTAQVMSMLLDVYNVLWVQEWNNSRMKQCFILAMNPPSMKEIKGFFLQFSVQNFPSLKDSIYPSTWREKNRHPQHPQRCP